MNSTAQAWEIAREIAVKQGTGSKEWYGLAHYILTLPERIEPIEQVNEMNELIPNHTIAMTSKEIAGLTGKRHDHVLRDIDNLLKTISPELGTGFSMTYEGNPAHGYRYFILDRDSAYCLVSGYDANARMRIIKRWQELEDQVKAPAPAFNIPQTYAAALQLAADQARQLEAAQPAIEFHERVGDDEGLHSIDEVAKALNAPPMKFRALLKKELDLFRLDGLPKQTHINNGYMRVIETVLPNGRVYPQPMFTGKGMIWVQQRLDHQLMGVQI